ncbi:LytR/AlgR family response regulator transcription factor [Spirosoma aerolatum]|uniref:LytR/AlgR family response regulator transcription factor n=1 Tax=Spirosoma aerolatum TaxID=1211326 RepID=UPI0009AEA81D|nr:response regulator [Spirosoma aerolatum]
MSSCLLVESDPVIASQLTDFLTQTTLFDPPIVCSTAMEAFQLLTDYPVDLIMLDLDLPDITGIQLLESLVNTPPVIVLADHAEQAAACYDLDVVVDFLLKPAPYLRFLRAIQRALLPQFSHSFIRDTNLVIDKKEATLFRSGRQLKRFVLDDIHYAKG